MTHSAQAAKAKAAKAAPLCMRTRVLHPLHPLPLHCSRNDLGAAGADALAGPLAGMTALKGLNLTCVVGTL